jgi:hypothetical protein
MTWRCHDVRRLTDHDEVTRGQLSTSSRLDIPVDHNRLRGQQRLDVAALVDRVGELEELTEPDSIAADPDLDGAGHGLIVPVTRGRR